MSGQIEIKDGFQLVGGKRLHFLECGSGEPLILLHSNGGSAYEYEEMFPLLASTFRVIAWDMPGHGDSDPLDRHLGVDQYADAVIGLLDALDISKAHVVGASIGGAICVSLASRHSARFHSVLITECPFRTPEEWKKVWLTTEANYSEATQSREKVSARLRKLDDHHFTRWNIDRNKAGTKTMLSVMWALREYDVATHLAVIRPRVDLIFGDKGPTVDKLERFKASARNVNVVVLKNVGHFPMLDDPPAFSDAISQLTKQNPA